MMSQRRILLPALLFLLAACSRDLAVNAPQADSASGSSQPRLLIGRNPEPILLELATDEATRAQGLMFREHLPPGRGMLFLFPKNDVYGFWMKNTLIPLDMVWIDEARRVVHLKRDVQPCRADPCPSYSPDVSARYVLELPAGDAARRGIHVGDEVTMTGIERFTVR